MTSLPRPVEVTAERVLGLTRSWAFVGVVVACFALVEVRLVVEGTYLHDEGILTWLYASYLAHDPVATAFFLKAKPVLAAMNLPGALFGTTGFYFGHVAIGCVGIVATAAAARAARVREWGLAALVVASSPMYVAGTAAGFSNVDAAALTAVALWLVFRAKVPGFCAAFAISLLPWVRFEAGVFAAVCAVALLARDRNPRFLLGLVAFPIAYLAAGAAWHEDALWAIHFPPALDYAKTGMYRVVEEEVRRTNASEIVFAIATVTPAIALAFSRLRDVERWARVAQACVVVFLAAMIGLPRLGVAMGYSQRYLLQILPLVALVVAYQLERASRANAAIALGVSSLACLALGSRGAIAAFDLSALAGSCVFAAVASRAPRLAGVALAAFVAAWPLASPPLDVLPSRRAALARALAWIDEHRADVASAPTIITNLKLLDAHLARTTRTAVGCIIQSDNAFELERLSNPANGQRARIEALARWRFYGHGVFASELAAHPGPPGSIVIIDDDARLVGLDVETLARGGAAVLVRSPGFSVVRLSNEAR